MNAIRALCPLAVSLFVFQSPALAQQLCLQPSSGFHVDGVSFGYGSFRITGVAGFDDGSGPALFVGGAGFASAGTQTTQSLAKWDGVSWSDTGVTANITFMVAYGGELYVYGGFPEQLSKWNGGGLTTLADQPNGAVTSMNVVDLGTGPQLYLSGTFTQIGATSVPGIARFDGSTWSAVPNGANAHGPFEAFDDGSGLKLYGFAAGTGSCPPTSLARLDGATWTSVGAFVHGLGCLKLYDLCAHDDGNGPALYVTGEFTSAGGVMTRDIARWNGATWSAMDTGILAIPTQGVRELLSFDDGSGLALYVCGGIIAADGSGYGILRWDGVSWSPVGVSGVGSSYWTPTQSSTKVQTIGLFDDGSGAKLVAAGQFESAGPASAWNVVRWDGSAWSNFGAGGQGIGQISCLKYLDGGSGPALYAGGTFCGAGAIAVNRIARWDGSQWLPLGGGMNHGVNDIEAFDDGSGLKLYAAGFFTQADGLSANGVARFDGVSWSSFGAPLPTEVRDLLPHGNRLYAALTSPTGLRMWNGTAWTNLGGPNGPVFKLAFFDGYVYATGQFTQVDGIPASGIGRYHEATGVWSAAGTTAPGGGFDLVVHDDGTGPALWLARSGGPKRLQGNVWTTPPLVDAHSFASIDFGLGRPTLVACSGNGVALRAWTGTGWLDMTSDTIDGLVSAIAAVPGSSSCAPEIFVAGRFTHWGDVVSQNIAKLTLCGEPGLAYCFGDGSLPTPCPCVPPNTVPNPSGAPGHGCANSFNLDGAKMCAVGTTSPDTVTLRVSGLTPVGFTQFFKGDAQNLSGVAFADGVRCADGLIIRFGGQNAVLGTAYYPNPSLGLNTPISNGGTPPGSGLTGHYQAIYRNATANFCTVDTLNVTNAVKITWN